MLVMKFTKKLISIAEETMELMCPSMVSQALKYKLLCM